MLVTTISGREVDPMHFDRGDVDVWDIAHALAHLCRFAGHVRTFYSVAQHSVLVSQAVPLEDALHALLHDASEAYINDIVRPVKHLDALRGYRTIETRVQQTIYRAFGLSAAEPASVALADNRVLRAEMRDLCPARRQLLDGPAWAPSIQPLGPDAAKQLFMARYFALVSPQPAAGTVEGVRM